MKQKPFVLRDNIFEYYDEYEERVTFRFDITQDPAGWQDVLKRLRSLRVIYTEPKSGFTFSYSVYKKRQALKVKDDEGNLIKEFYQGHFWVAHKQINKRLNRIYIGKDENMTPERLQEVAREISQGKLTLKQRA